MAIQFTLSGKPLTVDRNSKNAVVHRAAKLQNSAANRVNSAAERAGQTALAAMALPSGAA